MVNNTQLPVELTLIERARAEGMMSAFGVIEALLGHAGQTVVECPAPEAYSGQKKAVAALLETISNAAIQEAAKGMGIIRKHNVAAFTDGGFYVSVGVGIDVEQFRRFVKNSMAAETGKKQEG